MKKLIAVAALLAVAVQAHASPYFRPMDMSHLSPIMGGTLDPIGNGPRDALGMLPIFTHSPKDGCLLPSIVCEDWSPLAVGIGGNLSGGGYLAVGPVVNVLPAAKAIGLILLNKVTADSSFSELKNALSPNGSGTPDVAMSAGPLWVVKPEQNWKGSFRIFVGPQVRF